MNMKQARERGIPRHLARCYGDRQSRWPIFNEKEADKNAAWWFGLSADQKRDWTDNRRQT